MAKIIIKKSSSSVAPAWLAVHRITMAFLGALILVGAFLPWADAGLSTVSGYSLLFRWDQAPEVIRNAIPSSVALLPIVIGFLCLAFVVLAFVRSAAIENHSGIWFALLALSGAAGALGLALPFNAEALKKVLSFGIWIEIWACGALFLTALYLAAKYQPRSPENNIGANDFSDKLLYPAGFIILLAATLIVNYLFVNYTLIPKATEVVSRLAS